MKLLLTIFLAISFFLEAHAFSPLYRPMGTQRVALPTNTAFRPDVPPSLQRQRKSVASIQTMVFGLGAPEIAIILVAAAFLLGPQKLAEMGRDAGKIAGELKEVPKEFQKGLQEGEEQAKVMKASMTVEAEKAEEKKE